MEKLERLFHLELDLRDAADEMREEHIELIEALIERKPNNARQLMAKQIEKSRDRVLEAILGHHIGTTIKV